MTAHCWNLSVQSLAALRGVLLAERTRLGSLNLPLHGRGEMSGRDDVLLGLLILAALAAGIWALSRLLAIGSRHRAYDSPRRLFLSLCQAHRLRWSQRWLLWRLASSQGLKDPRGYSWSRSDSAPADCILCWPPAQIDCEPSATACLPSHPARSRRRRRLKAACRKAASRRRSRPRWRRCCRQCPARPWMSPLATGADQGMRGEGLG